MKRKLILSLLLAGTMAFGGCSSSTPSDAAPQPESTATAEAAAAQAAQPQADEKVTVKIAGSTSVAPLMKELKEVYEAENSNVTLEIQESGSSAGITAAIEGAAELGMSSRDLKDEELAQGLEDIAIALDGIAVVVHPDNTVTDLTAAQIASIYSGEITDWSELGGESGEIIVVSREEGSGTRGAFEELLDLEDISDNALFENSTGAVKTNVAGSKNAIGYISLGSMDDTVLALQVGGVACSVEAVKDGSYVIARPFLVCTKGAPAGAAADLIDFILSDAGQEIVVDNNYISVN